jgi:hypothetical protein
MDNSETQTTYFELVLDKYGSREKVKKKFSILVIVLVFNTTFNNISVIFWLQHFGQ